MAATTSTLGRFKLVGLLPAPRGVPQIEVKFDIDANGIVHVSAKDKATGKEQSIKIEASSGLSKDEVEALVQEAKAHEADDAARRDQVEKRNQLDTLVYQTQKVDENGDKLPESEGNSLEEALTEGAPPSRPTTSDQIEAALKAIESLSHEMASQMYQADDAGAAGGGAADAGFEQAAAAGGDDIIDAEFEETD